MARSMLARLSAAAAAAVFMAGCQSPAAYHPRGEGGGTGYSDEQLAGNRYRVTFTGNSSTKRTEVENYLLLRSAEVTLKAGYHWFLFDTRDTEAKTTYHSSFTGWPGWGGRGWYWHSWALGPRSRLDSYPETSFEAYAEIVLLTGEQAMAEARAIKAEEVIEHLGPQAHPAKPG